MNDCKAMDIDMEIANKYLQLTDRKITLELKKIKPSNYHKWGVDQHILDKSSTLKNIVLKTGLDRVADFKQTFHEVLTELGITYTIVPLPSKDPGMKGVMYDLHITPRWSFGHFASTEREATSYSAKMGLQFLIEMCY